MKIFFFANTAAKQSGTPILSLYAVTAKERRERERERESVPGPDDSIGQVVVVRATIVCMWTIHPSS